MVDDADAQSEPQPLAGSGRSWRDTARSGLAVGLAALTCRLVSLAKELLVAYLFGAGSITDAYALVMLIPGFATSLFLQAARTAYLAQIARYWQTDLQAAQKITRQFFIHVTLVSVAIAVTAGATLWWFWPYFFPWGDQELQSKAKAMLWPACGLVITYGWVTALTAILNGRLVFVTPQWTHVIPTLAVVGWLVAVRPASWRALVDGLFYGTLVQAAVLAWLAARHWGVGSLIRATSTIRSWPWWGLAIPIMLANVATQVNSYVDRMMASSLEPGAVAVLAWAGLLRDMISGTVIGGFVGVLLPHFAYQIAARRDAEAAATVGQLMRLGAVVVLPFSAVCAAAALLAVHGVQMGRLDQQALSSLAACFAAYAVGFYADLASNSLYQVLIALRRTRILLLYALFVNVIPNVLLNLLLIRPLGATGLALATSAVGYCTLIANYLAVCGRLPVDTKAITRTFVYAMALSVCVSVAAWWGGQEVLRWFTPSAVSSMLVAVVGAAAGTIAYAAVAVWTPIGGDLKRLWAELFRGWSHKGPISK